MADWNDLANSNREAARSLADGNRNVMDLLADSNREVAKLLADGNCEILDLLDKCYREIDSLITQSRNERSAINRAYYAAYSRTTHVLYTHVMKDFPSPCNKNKRLANPKHSDVKRKVGLADLVDQHLQCHVADWKKLAWSLCELYKYRVLADYKPFRVVGKAEVRSAITLMDDVFKMTKGSI